MWGFFILFFLVQIGYLGAQSPYCTQGDCIDGFGRVDWPSGDAYLGHWKDTHMHGYGIYYWQNGSKYIGYWKAGKMSGKGTLFYKSGRITAGRWKANELIELERPTLDKATAQAHAHAQWTQLLIDRPALRAWTSTQDTVARWVQAQFAGAATETLLYWRAEGSTDFPIPEGVTAAHRYPTATQEGLLWIAPRTDGEALWADLVYELFNIQNYRTFQHIAVQAAQGALTREAYIWANARLEFEAILRCKQFYQTIWQPHCAQQQKDTTPAHWFMNSPTTFKAWRARFTDKSGYPWVPYGNYYDTLH